MAKKTAKGGEEKGRKEALDAPPDRSGGVATLTPPIF